MAGADQPANAQQDERAKRKKEKTKRRLHAGHLVSIKQGPGAQNTSWDDVSREPKRSEADLGNCKSSKSVAYVIITLKRAKLLRPTGTRLLSGPVFL
jgi:hypothetical protein